MSRKRRSLRAMRSERLPRCASVGVTIRVCGRAMALSGSRTSQAPGRVRPHRPHRRLPPSARAPPAVDTGAATLLQGPQGRGDPLRPWGAARCQPRQGAAMPHRAARPRTPAAEVASHEPWCLAVHSVDRGRCRRQQFCAEGQQPGRCAWTQLQGCRQQNSGAHGSPPSRTTPGASPRGERKRRLCSHETASL